MSKGEALGSGRGFRVCRATDGPPKRDFGYTFDLRFEGLRYPMSGLGFRVVVPGWGLGPRGCCRLHCENLKIKTHATTAEAHTCSSNVLQSPCGYIRSIP